MKKKSKTKSCSSPPNWGALTFVVADLLLLLQIYSLNIEFYQLQATYTKTGQPAQWALATWAPEGPVSSTWG